MSFRGIKIPALLILAWISLSVLAEGVRCSGEPDAPPSSKPLGSRFEEMFSLRIFSYTLLTGTRFQPGIQVFNPDDRRPVEGVEVTGTVILEDEPGGRELHARGSSNARGIVPLSFDLPDFWSFERARLQVTARRGDVERNAEVKLRGYPPSALVSTDKAIYRPGQTLRIRASWSVANRVLGDSSVYFELQRAYWKPVLRHETHTSNAGVASAEWQLPSDMKEGIYRVVAGRDGATDGVLDGVQEIRIASYDLPRLKFRVNPVNSEGSVIVYTVDRCYISKFLS